MIKMYRVVFIMIMFVLISVISTVSHAQTAESTRSSEQPQNPSTTVSDTTALQKQSSTDQLPTGVNTESLTTSQKKALEKLTPSQRKVVEAELSKTGGQITPETIERLKTRPELKDLKHEEALKTVFPGEKEGVIPTDREMKEPSEKKEEELEKEEDVDQKDKKDKALRRFGIDFFRPAKNRILTTEKMISEGRIPKAIEKDALSGFVGPLDIISTYVNVTIPPRYVLNPGDGIIIHYWGDNVELTTLRLILDKSGAVIIPKVGRFIARGMTLTQFQNAARKQLKRVFRGKTNLIATLDKLRSIQIFITGEVFRPGSYAVSAVTTLFNALYACGGPADSGSLRHIKLFRGDETMRIDFYDYLLKGDSRYDLPLKAGDTIFISKVSKLISVDGEINHPAIYELKKQERLKDLIRLANGVKPTGMLQRVQIRSVRPNKERVIIDIDMTRDVPSSNPVLFDGDSVMVSSILPEIVNMVTLEGKVERPGDYELKRNMRISDLFSEINRPLGEAYLGRTDVIRMNEDGKTTTLIPIHLGRAIQRDSIHDIKLAPMDRIIVYSKWDVKFLPERIITITGAVQKPGDYERSEGMRINDLLIMAGGVMPNAFLERADLLRYDFEKEISTVIPVNLRKVLNEDVSNNVLLSDKDVLRIYTIKESKFIPPRKITISGAVQRPGEYERSENMTIEDLLTEAGGLMPNVYSKRADLLRYDFKNESYTNISINLDKLLKGDMTENIRLSDGDVMRIYSIKEKEYIPPKEVSIFGAVQRPGTYIRFEGMRVNDLLVAAGGLLPGTIQKIDIAKARSQGKTEIITVDLELIQRGDETQNVFLDDQDVLTIRKESEFYEKPRWITVSGEVNYPGTYALYGKEDRLSDVLKRAGGLTRFAYPKGTVFTRKGEHIPSNEMRQDLILVNKIVDTLNDLEYGRQIARSAWLWQKEKMEEAQPQLFGADTSTVVTGEGDTAEAAAVSMAPSIANATGETIEGFLGALESAPAVVSKSRRLQEAELVPSERVRVVIKMNQLLKKKGGSNDILLMDGDTIHVPRKFLTVSVIGAVMRPTWVSLVRLEDHEYYIEKAGGYAEDANIEKVLIMRVDGSIEPVNRVESIEPGDIIYVPPKVVALDIIQRIDKIVEAVKFALVTAGSVAVFIALLAMF
ncbi:MAG: SLBB domain-containing protein [Thermodesulfobacteriota bacterium]|nr:SLBB domain-containing protein [Thermodesulfobacteriota bacterium]